MTLYPSHGYLLAEKRRGGREDYGEDRREVSDETILEELMAV
jgi:hypothetical protein